MPPVFTHKNNFTLFCKTLVYTKKSCIFTLSIGRNNKTTTMQFPTVTTQSKTTTERATEVAKIIRSQFGNQFGMMVKVKQMVYDTENCGMLAMKFGGSRKANYVKIVLCGDDTYFVEFAKIGRDYNFKIVKSAYGVYCDQLRAMFTEVTGLYTSMNG